MADRPVAKVKDKPTREKNWLYNLGNCSLSTPAEVLIVMSKVFHAYCRDYISEKTYRLLFAGLKEIRKGRDAEETRRVFRDLGMPFVGLQLVGPSEKKPPPLPLIPNGEGEPERSDE